VTCTEKLCLKHLYKALFEIFNNYVRIVWAHGSVVVKALCYRLEGQGFKTP
jgi:hypothetical protein